MLPKSFYLGLTLILPGFLLLNACRPFDGMVAKTSTALLPVEPSATVPSSPVTPATLEGIEWYLISYMDRKGSQVKVLPGGTISIIFHQGQVSGSAGCNRYYARYQVEDSTLSLSSAEMTEMFCMEPDGIMEQENTYLAALGSTAAYILSNERLQLFDEQGRTILTFRRR